MAAKRKIVEQTPREKVLEAYQTAVAQSPASPLAQTNLGWGLQYADRSEEAVAAFQRAVELDPNSVDAYFGLGLSTKRLGKKDDAKRAFEKAIALADLAEDSNRGKMLKRLAGGHLREMQTGDWDLGGLSRLN